MLLPMFAINVAQDKLVFCMCFSQYLALVVEHCAYFFDIVVKASSSCPAKPLFCEFWYLPACRPRKTRRHGARRLLSLRC